MDLHILMKKEMLLWWMCLPKGRHLPGSGGAGDDYGQRGGFSGNHKSHGKKGGCSRYRENRRNHGGEKERGVDSVVPYYCTDRL